MYTLYYLPGSCSMAIHVVLNELGQEFKLENVAVPAGQPRPAEFLKINPRGNVPVLFDGTHLFREGAAIMIYLLDTYKNELLPTSGYERAKALEWLMFCNATLHPAYARAFGAMRNFTGEVQEKVIATTVEQINKLWQDVEIQLENNTYLCGDKCTVGDILLSVIANWAKNVQGIVIGANAKRLCAQVIARPSFQKALQSEQVEYKAA